MKKGYRLVDIETGKLLQEQPKKDENVCKYVSVHKRYFTYSDLKGCNCVDKRTLETLERIKDIGELEDDDSFRNACDALMNMFSSSEYRSYLNLEYYSMYKGIIRYFVMAGKYSIDSVIARFPDMYDEILRIR